MLVSYCSISQGKGHYSEVQLIPVMTATGVKRRFKQLRKEEEEEAARAVRDEALRQEQIRLRESREIEAAEALAKLQELAEAEEDDDNEDYEADNYDDDDDDSNKIHDDNAADNKRHNWSSYQPPRDSRLYNYLSGMKNDIFDSSNRSAREARKCWYPPSTSALSKDDLDPFSYCVETTWVYHFDPFVQFHQKIGKIVKEIVKEHECVHCLKSGFLKDNGWYWRPQHYFQLIVRLLHRQLLCQKGKGGCGRTFAEFHRAAFQFSLQLEDLECTRP
jgi:hypothetical protein